MLERNGFADGTSARFERGAQDTDEAMARFIARQGVGAGVVAEDLALDVEDTHGDGARE